MRILFISSELTGSALLQRLISEDCEVKLYIHKTDWKNCYSGIVEKTNDWKSELEWVGKDGLILFDDVIFGDEQESLRAAGYTVVGSSKLADLFELDRKHFQEVLSSYDIPSLPLHSFETAQQAIDFVVEHPDCWVVKQSSHLSFLNYVGYSKTGSDVIRVLERYKRRGISPVFLQKYVHGIEVGVARYFNGDDWVGPIEINHEYKRLNEGDVGPLTPEMGTVLWYTEDEVPLFNRTLGRFREHLRKVDFRGDFDINFIINESGAWPLEATPRFGCPSTEIQSALHISPWAEFLKAVGSKKAYDLKYQKGFGIAVSLVASPFPYEPDASKGDPDLAKRLITFSPTLTDEDRLHIHFEEVSKIDDQYYWAGKYGIVLHVTAYGDTVEKAREKVYERVSKIQFAGMFYRKDIGNRVFSFDISKLKEFGWL